MAATNYLEEKLIDLVLRGVAFTSPGETFLALFTADPTDAPTANENTDASYLRQSTGATPSSAWDAVTGGNGQTKNNNVITFPAITTAQITITHWCIYDTAGVSTPPVATEGNPLIHGALTASKVLDVSDVASFPVDALTITIS